MYGPLHNAEQGKLAIAVVAVDVARQQPVALGTCACVLAIRAGGNGQVSETARPGIASHSNTGNARTLVHVATAATLGPPKPCVPQQVWVEPGL